jgi:4-hydroxy-tetrahydrodipicolinate synthase
LTDIIEKIFVDGNPAGIKAILEAIGICKAHLRLPLVNVNKETLAAINKLVANY